MKALDQIRKPQAKLPLSRAVTHTVVIIFCGLLTGVLIKLLDIYTTNLGNIFSRLSVWVFICTAISIYSNTAARAAINVFGYCNGMLLTYYITAEITNSVYSPLFAYGWAAFALLTLPMGFCVWYAKGKRTVSTIISALVIVVMLASAAVLFDRIRISGILLTALTAVSGMEFGAAISSATSSIETPTMLLAVSR